MTSKQISKYFIIATLLFLLIADLILLNLLSIEKKNTAKAVDLTKSIMSNKSFALEYYFTTSLNNNNVYIPDFKNEFFFNNIKKGVTLVIRFSELYCGDCVNFILLKTKKLIKNKNIRIILLPNYSSKNSSKIICTQFELGNIPTCNIERLNLPVEDCGYPYCFTIDSTYKVSNVFVPDKTVPSLTSSYFNMIEKRYFDSSN